MTPELNSTKQISVKGIPETLHTAIRQAAINERTTAQIVVLQALKDAGLPVPDELLVPHVRRARGEE